MLNYKMRRNYYKVKKFDMAFIIVVVFLAGIIFASFTLPHFSSEAPFAIENGVELKIPAVDAEGNGVTGLLITSIRPGTGQVLVSINDLFAQYDTQLSARTAAHAASKYTKIDTSKLDITYTIKVNATAIEGPSAGSTMAIATVLALENITPPANIMTTGSISEDGKILPVGAIYEKAKAAKEVGATLFLVPDGQSSSVQRERVKSCSKMGEITYCKVDYKDTQVNIGQQLGITVKEVNTLSDALEYYTNQTKAIQNVYS